MSLNDSTALAPIQKRGSSDGVRAEKIEGLLGVLSGAPEQKEVQLPAAPSNGAGRSENATDINPPASSVDRPALELDDDEADEDQPKRKRRGKALVEFAEEQGLKPEKLYDLEVAIGDDHEPVSVGALKDHYKATREFERQRDDFEDYRTESENKIIQGRTQIDGVLSELVKVVAPNDLAQAFQTFQENAARQAVVARQQLHEWFPEWADAQVKARDRELIEDVYGSYGITKTEIAGITDPRLVRILVHGARLMRRYERLKAGTREKVPSKEAPSRKSSASRPDFNNAAKALAKSGDKLGAMIATVAGG